MTSCRLLSRVQAPLARMDKAIEFAKWAVRTTALGDSVLTGHLNDGTEGRMVRESYTGMDGARRSTRQTKLEDAKTGASLTWTRRDARTAHVDLLDSPEGNELNPANARGHLRVANVALPHFKKNRVALDYSAVPLSVSAGPLTMGRAGSKARLNGHYVKHAQRHGFRPVDGRHRPGSEGSALVPPDWTPGESPTSREIRRRLGQ